MENYDEKALNKFLKSMFDDKEKREAVKSFMMSQLEYISKESTTTENVKELTKLVTPVIKSVTFAKDMSTNFKEVFSEYFEDKKNKKC